ncbi:D-alanine--D-alanine ligase family protein [Rhizobium alvei]|uniref:D-alanine--D-alanine ligase n=1 Tax=Rhizobium alvei TaxID=1132659 RepID=A0ABT8YK87_9HYPH|nr:D-alanine--D-alanine ligase family protein [Rhizobium alvei]MDO6963773.1 D-alanine--D-alanine ligase family protein [Rhizobium alvei]
MPFQTSRPRILVLFGGRSSEHDVSIKSATNVLRAIDPAKYEPVPVYVTHKGHWLPATFDGTHLETPLAGPSLCLLPGGCGRLLASPEEGTPYEVPKIDFAFPVLHGLGGEDGSIQGLCEAALVPYLGCGIQGSAAALDKDVAKRLMLAAGVPVARWRLLTEERSSSFAELDAEFGLPFFVKPARSGSSVGVRRVSGSQEFGPALEEGFCHDARLLAEEAINGREIECAVIEDGDGSLFVSHPGEIIPAESHGFYSFDAKYIDEHGATLKVPADLTPETEAAICVMAERAFRALGCNGMARVDFFLKPDGSFLVNEVNTIPGFTDISMYPMAIAASGIDMSELIARLIRHAKKRHPLPQ